MSRALFAGRKAFLTQKISDINFQLMQLSQKAMNNSAKGNAIESKSANTKMQAGKYASVFGQNAAMGFLQNVGKQKMQAMYKLKMSDDQIANMKGRLESQVKSMTQELATIEKGEDAAIKRGTPKYA